MRKLLVIPLLFIFSLTFSQDFNYNYLTTPCAKFEYNFTASGVGIPDSIVWNWDNGATTTTISAPWEASNIFSSAGIYNVTMNLYIGGVNTASASNDVIVYDVPNLSIDYFAPGVVCAGDDSIKIVIDSVNIESPDLSMTIDWGDGTTSTGDYSSLGDSISHKYLTTSCGNTVTVGNNTIEDKFLIVVTANNQCSQLVDEFFFRPADIKSAPNINILIEEVEYDSIAKAFYVCQPQEITITNPSFDENNCLDINNVSWDIYDSEGNLVDNCDDCLEEFDGNFNSNGTFSIELTQGNVCGTSTVSTNFIVKEPPFTLFQIPDVVSCYPSEVIFENLSALTVQTSVWDFLGDSSVVAVVEGIADTSYIYEDEGEFKIKLQTFDGYCYNYYDSTLILDHRCMNLYVPNAFTPESSNPDLNAFKPAAINLEEYRIDIYNMYGEQLWHSEEIEAGEPAEGWDGTFKGEDCPAGTYIWKISAKIDQGDIGGIVDWDGQVYKETKNKSKRSRSGTFILIR